jgi:hypothetical protein
MSLPWSEDCCDTFCNRQSMRADEATAEFSHSLRIERYSGYSPFLAAGSNPERAPDRGGR